MMSFPQNQSSGASEEGGDPLLVEAGRLRSLPGFPEVVKAYAAHIAWFREVSRSVNKLISQEIRFWAVLGVFYLSCESKLAGGDGGVTYGQIRALCAHRPDVSLRTLETVLSLLVFTGFVVAKPDAHGRRHRFFWPTDRMFEFYRQRMDGIIRLLDMLEPQGQYAKSLQDDPELLTRFVVSSGREQYRGRMAVERMREFIAFLGGRDGATVVVLAVLLSAFAGKPTPSRVQISKRFGVSKSHILDVINQGVRLGYFALGEDALPSATDLLRESFSRWVSIELAFFAGHLRLAKGSSSDELTGH